MLLNILALKSDKLVGTFNWSQFCVSIKSNNFLIKSLSTLLPYSRDNLYFSSISESNFIVPNVSYKTYSFNWSSKFFITILFICEWTSVRRLLSINFLLFIIALILVSSFL